MNYAAYGGRDLQNMRGLLLQARREKLTLEQLDADVARTVEAMNSVAAGDHPVKPVGLRCSRCGGPAIKVSVNTHRGNQVDGDWTRAIQCQNRPAKDSPWLPRHCGHTEYIVEAR
ncbi:MAG: hypothetical protein RBS34_17590 [Desulfofustis sp.]|jgi:hypothetical protein|nr:hypothetical protein [Desulfofustis sp.]